VLTAQAQAKEHENFNPPLNPLPSREGRQIVPSPLAGEGQSLPPKYLSGGEGGFSGQKRGVGIVYLITSTVA